MAILSIPVAAMACGDDAPSTNTVDPPSTSTDGAGSMPPTGSVEGNVGAITDITPVAGGDDSIVQGNQPMQSFAVD